jgi:signal transduction histidine kinase
MLFASVSQCSSANNEGHTRRHFESADALSDRSRVRLQTFHDTETAEAVHDFRNILSTGFLLSELALMDLPETSPVSATVRRIRVACADANDLCNRMLDDSRNASKGVERVDLSTLVMAMAPLLTTYVPAESALRFDLTESTPLADASPGGIHQVVMNLVKNAAEALGDQPGAVTVSTGLVELDAVGTAEAVCQSSKRTGQYSYLAVSDTGCGMDEATRARLFERYFTTKADGHGLGMASIRRIVHGCGGEIQVHTQVGGGTQIRVLFPLGGPGS